MESSLKPARLPKVAATATPTTTPTAVKRPCQVISMPATSNNWGSRPIFIASRTALFITPPDRAARPLPHPPRAPSPPPWHPERHQQTCQQQPGACPHQVVAPVPLHLDARELPLPQERVLVPADLRLLPRPQGQRLRPQPDDRQLRRAGGDGRFHRCSLGGRPGAVDHVAHLQEYAPGAVSDG